MVSNMTSQQLLLSWKDHNGALVSVFENLWKHKTLVDCTLAADGHYMKAHKVVLSACSSYFELLFSQESEKNPIVILKDVKYQELEAAVRFMYRGEVEVCEDRLADFLEVADSLQIKGLGSDGRDYKGRPSVPKSSKSPKSPSKPPSRKDGANSHSENTAEISITLDDKNSNNESTSHHQQPHRETSSSSPIPSTLAVASSYSIPSASTSYPVRFEGDGDREGQENNRCSSPTVSTFPSGDTVPSDVNTVIKTEPVTDTYLDEKSDETERDFDDVTMMEDQEDWEDPHMESMGDDHASNQHDPGFPTTHMKTEEPSSDMAGVPTTMEHVSSEAEAVWVEGGAREQFTSVFFKDQPGAAAWEQPPAVDPAQASGPDPGAGVRFGSGREADGAHGPASALEDFRHPSTGFESIPIPGASGHFMASSPLDAHSARPTLNNSARMNISYGKATGRLGASSIHATPHLGGAQYSCPECNYETNVLDDLTEHRQSLHGGARSEFKCTRCSFITESHDALAVHMKFHSLSSTGNKNFKCQECNYKGSNFSNFRRHQRIHTGERPFKCSVCSATFTQSHILKLHKAKCHSSHSKRS